MRVCKLVCAVLLLGWSAACATPPRAEAPQTAPTGASGAVAEPAPLPALTSRRPVKAPFVWRIQRGEAVSHALGTVHVGVSLGDVLGQGNPEILDDARDVFLEADLAGLNPLTFLNASLLPVGESLRAMLPHGAWRELLIQTGLPPGMVDRMRPWVAHMMAQVGALRELLVREGNLSTMDLEIQQRRQRAHLPVAYLETAKEQIDILAGIGDEDYAKHLGRWLVEGNVAQEMRELLATYRSGDLDAMTALVFNPKELKRAPDYYERLLFRRNRQWLLRLGPELDEGGVFIAVGLGHLLGEQGLLTAWREAGYTVTRVLSPRSHRP